MKVKNPALPLYANHLVEQSFSKKILKIKQNTNFGMEVDGLKEMKLQPLHYSMIYLENFPSLIIQNLKNGYCSISIVHAMISHSEQQIIL